MYTMTNTEIMLILWSIILTIVIIILIYKQIIMQNNIKVMKRLFGFWYCRDKSLRDDKACGPTDIWDKDETKRLALKLTRCLNKNQSCRRASNRTV